jgi:hypothetical protein
MTFGDYERMYQTQHLFVGARASITMANLDRNSLTRFAQIVKYCGLKMATLASFKSKEAVMSTDKQTTWEKYVSAWKGATAKAKTDALRQSVAATCVYTDPATIANGHEELITYMLAFHQQVPGGHFVTTYFLAHHDVSIAKWNMVSGDGVVIGDGVSYGQYNEQGMLITMTGFFETPSQ